jgi:hypothetical protein
MLVFNLTTLHLWGRTLAKYPQAPALAYADDGYIKARMSVALQVLAELKHVLKEDADLDLNVSKTSLLPKGVTQQAVFDVAYKIINASRTLKHLSRTLKHLSRTLKHLSRTLKHLSGDVSLASFCPEGFVGIGVPIGTDAFVQNFVAKTCRAIIDDVEKLDAIQDGFIHYQLLRFCQAHPTTI